MKLTRKRLWLLTLYWTLAAAPLSPCQPPTLPATPPNETRFFPLADIHRGLRGVAYTVFEGVLPEPMEVEILGTLTNALGPGRDMILARLHGTKPDYTGVVAGMSGSPVYIDGKLVGALSYRIGQFSKEPIAGITPIQEMLNVRDLPITEDWVPHPHGGMIAVRMGSQDMQSNQLDIHPIDTPLLFSGFSQDTLDHFGDRFRALGLTPVAGLGSSSPNTLQPEPLVPGSAVSAIFVRGDLSMAGTCTVTYIDPTRLLACGHPITQNGPISMPMTKASVVATLASPLNAFKIVNTTQTVGSFTQDRASAILGRFDTPARMIPVTVEVTGGPKPSTVRFEVLDDRQLTPNTMLVSVYQSLQQTDTAAAEQSYALSGTLAIANQPPVTLGGIMAPNAFNTGAINAALYVGERFDRVYQNPIDLPTITGLSLRLKAQPERHTATLDTARLSRAEAHPRDILEVELTLRPFHAEPQVLRLPISLPGTLTPGTYRLLIADGSTLDRLTTSAPSTAHAPGLADTIAALNRTRRNDTFYVALLDRSPQALLQSGPLQQLPLSMANILEPLRDTQQLQLNGESVLQLGAAPTTYAVTGSQVVRLTIR